MPVTEVKKIPHDANYNKTAVLVGEDRLSAEYEILDVDDNGRLVTRTMIWNSDTLSWEAATGSLGAGGAVEVTNFPATQQVAGIVKVTDNYKLSDMDVTGDPSYFGYLDVDGGWYIMELNDTNGTSRYYKGNSGYVAAWTDRDNLDYDYYDEIF